MLQYWKKSYLSTMFQASNTDIVALALAGLSVVLGIYNLLSLRGFNKLRKTFFAGRSGADLENVIRSLHQELQKLQEEHMILEQAHAALKHDFGFAVQKIGIVRFNPFGDEGGNFSFCVALLDGHDSGVVLTSMHGRQQNRIYTKKIEEGKSEMPLTEEEAQAIQTANSKFQISNVKQVSSQAQ